MDAIWFVTVCVILSLAGAMVKWMACRGPPGRSETMGH